MEKEWQYLVLPWHMESPGSWVLPIAAMPPPPPHPRNFTVLRAGTEGFSFQPILDAGSVKGKDTEKL